MLADFSVRRWQFTLVVFIGLIALGAHALVTIPKAEDPSFPRPSFYVIALLPGSAPKDLERLVIDPLEAALWSLKDVKKVAARVEESVGVVDIDFQTSSDPDKKRDEILRELSTLRPKLPAELTSLELRQVDTANVNIREVALISEDASYRALDVQARSLKRRLQNVPGVRGVDLAGLPKQEVRITLDLPRMVVLGIAPHEVYDTIAKDSANVPAGSVDVDTRRFSVKTSGDYTSLDEIRDSLVRASGSARGTVRVRDVAQVELAPVDGAELARFDGRRAILVAASQKDGANVFDVAKGIDRELDAFARTLPRSIHVVRGFDQARNVGHRLGGFVRDFGLAIVLVLVTLLPLGVRASLVVMASIPLSLALGLVLLQLFGFTINQLSVVGFVIALGLLVDDSVVVVENITRHLRWGVPPRRAAIHATREIAASVLGCTATLVFAFIPLLALPGDAGAFIRSLPVAVISTVVASLVVSFTVVPFLASVLLTPSGKHGNVFLRALHGMIETSYRPILERALAYPKLTVLGAFALIAATMTLVPKIGFSLFPKAGTPQFMVQIETANDANLAETDRAARFVEQVLARRREVRHVATVVGKGHPQIFYNVFPRNTRANVADVFAEADVPSPAARAALYAALRGELANDAGAKLELKELENGPPIDAPIAVRVLGDDEEALLSVASRVETILRATQGTRDVRNPSKERRSDVRVRVDRDKAALLAVASPDVDRAIRLAVGGIVAGSYREDSADEAYDIRLALPRTDVQRARTGAFPGLDVLDQTYVGSAHARAVPLSEVARLELEPSPTNIRHYNRERVATVSADVREGYNTERLTQAVWSQLTELPLPPGIHLKLAGEAETSQESFGGVGVAVLVAAFGILAILVLEFRTLKSTLIVASVIPLGVIGGLLALYLSGNTLSFTATIGFVALMGIEVKNSILLVDVIGQLRERGLGVDEAIQRGGEARFIPILLTTLTAIGGLIPLILEHSSFYSPLALVILGGLVSSTILARIVTPVLYKLLVPAVEEDRGDTIPSFTPAFPSFDSAATAPSSQAHGGTNEPVYAIPFDTPSAPGSLP
ncbi:efflux RND transporter permease subunit [Pendulispora albinea]|uniref:Efflux RND transporter permease subunit n=1 Tax=Pendulispora albinea TaxID=2741071 RepID=A0ABZ2M9K9_9BACT